MFSSTEMAVAWAAEVLGVQSGTYMPSKFDGDAICIVDRTGGDLDYPHDAPEIAFQVWARNEADAESGATCIAIACKTRPPDDPHVNHVRTPRVFSYGREERGWFVWQCSVAFDVTLLD